jgi:hypothetical protein
MKGGRMKRGRMKRTIILLMLVFALVSIGVVAQNATTGMTKMFVAGVVSHGKFVPFDDVTGKHRWDNTPKNLNKQHVMGGSSEKINLKQYEGKAIFIFADLTGKTSTDFYGTSVIGSGEKSLAEQLWKDAKGGSSE